MRQPEFGIAVKIARSILGLTQKEFANRINTNEWTISKIESGRENPTNEVLKNLVDVLRDKRIISFLRLMLREFNTMKTRSITDTPEEEPQ